MSQVVYQAKADQCEFCGRWCEVDEWTVHHLFKRSTHPHLIADPKNLMVLCPSCHWRATYKREFELLLQKMFYGKTKASLAHGAGRGDVKGR